MMIDRVMRGTNVNMGTNHPEHEYYCKRHAQLVDHCDLGDTPSDRGRPKVWQHA